MVRKTVLACVAAALLGLIVLGLASSKWRSGPPRLPDVAFVTTPQVVVEEMLELAQVTKDDVVYDLGCGDGRIPITAAKKYGSRAYGFDIDPQRVRESRKNAAKNNVSHLVTIEERDIFTLDLSGADVITLFLLPSLNVKLIPQLDKLRPGVRIVSHHFDMEGVIPDQVIAADRGGESGRTNKVYLWTTPLKKEQAGPKGQETPDQLENRDE